MSLASKKGALESYMTLNFSRLWSGVTGFYCIVGRNLSWGACRHMQTTWGRFRGCEGDQVGWALFSVHERLGSI